MAAWVAEGNIVICGRLGGKQGAQEASLNGWVGVTGRCHSAHTSPEALSQLLWQRKGGENTNVCSSPGLTAAADAAACSSSSSAASSMSAAVSASSSAPPELPRWLASDSKMFDSSCNSNSDPMCECAVA